MKLGKMRGIGIENGSGKKGEIGFKGERLKAGREGKMWDREGEIE